MPIFWNSISPEITKNLSRFSTDLSRYLFLAVMSDHYLSGSWLDVISDEGLQQTSQESSSNSANSRRRISMDYRYLQQQPGPQSLSFLDHIPTPPYSPPGTRPGSLRGTEILNMSSTNMPPFPHRSDSNISASSDSINSSRALDRGASQHDSHRLFLFLINLPH